MKVFFSKTDEQFLASSYIEIKNIAAAHNANNRKGDEEITLASEYNKCTACKYALWKMRADKIISCYCRAEHTTSWTKEIEMNGQGIEVCEGYHENFEEENDN